jgi:glutamate-1-semialdehyde 2,1-aminomutase/spore coat polysaccharide biosynthesis protein SpsF
MITAVIAQARMGSTRLPGKVMMPLMGLTVLAHVLTRCQAIPGVDVVCCATTDSESDDRVAAEARGRGAEVYRGSTEDVLDRYHKAAQTLGADVIIRVTCDCPVIDPDVCGAVLKLRAETGSDYVANNLVPSWPHGLDCEAFTKEALGRAATEAKDPYEREHVTPWLRQNSNVKRANLHGPGGDVAELRWTIDYPGDYEFFQALFGYLSRPLVSARMQDFLEILRLHPEIAEMNRAHRQARHGVSSGA